jgi:hypothetical protein
LGLYQQLTPNLLLLAELSRIRSLSQIAAGNQSTNGNVGAFLSF